MGSAANWTQALPSAEASCIDQNNHTHAKMQTGLIKPYEPVREPEYKVRAMPEQNVRFRPAEIHIGLQPP